MEVSLSQESFGGLCFEELFLPCEEQVDASGPLYRNTPGLPYSIRQLAAGDALPEAPRKPRADKGKVLRLRACVSTFLPKKTKYPADITLDDVEQMRQQAATIPGERERKRELNRVSALRSRLLRRLRLERDAGSLSSLRETLRKVRRGECAPPSPRCDAFGGQALDSEQLLATASAAVAHHLQCLLSCPEHPDIQGAEESITHLGEVLEVVRPVPCDSESCFESRPLQELSERRTLVREVLEEEVL